MKSTVVFLDSEFTGLNQHSKLISLALVSESGAYFYAEFNEINPDELSPWIIEKVKLSYLEYETYMDKTGDNLTIKGSENEVKAQLLDWLTQFELIEIWADVLAYDWVLFCELFGGALQTPDNIFFTPFDLSTLMRISGLINPKGKYQGDLKRAEFAGIDDSIQHNALNDAMTSMQCYKKLKDIWKNNF